MNDVILTYKGEEGCGEWSEENAQCWFYFLLAGGCPRGYNSTCLQSLQANMAPVTFEQEDGTTTWPWGYVDVLPESDSTRDKVSKGGGTELSMARGGSGNVVIPPKGWVFSGQQ